MIVLIGGVKGGTGKSTIATNIAAWLAGCGRDVLLVDVDPQRTAYKWAGRRQANWNQAPRVNVTQASGDETFDVIKDMASRYEEIVIDAGGYDSNALRSAALACQKFYVPLRASQPDIETSATVNQTIKEVRALNRGMEAHALISVAPTNPVITEAQEAREALSELPELILSKQIIRDRKAYRDAMTEGLGVVEMDNNKAAAEIQLLCQEIYEYGQAKKAI